MGKQEHVCVLHRAGNRYVISPFDRLLSLSFRPPRDFLKLSTYLTFFAVVLTFYGLPLNIIRDVYLTARSFITRLRALVRYHNATRDMDRRYPNATEEELTAMSDRTCIICREEMVATANNNTNPADNQAPNDQAANQVQDGPNVTPKKLPCGHIFHFQCLRSWLERQQSCPTWLVFFPIDMMPLHSFCAPKGLLNDCYLQPPTCIGD